MSRFGHAAANAGAGLNLAPEVPASGVFHPETFMLDNGMEVVVVENHRAPVVAHWVWYKVGTADSPPGKSGLPHFLEHLMFKGTGEIPPGEFSKIVARLRRQRQRHDQLRFHRLLPDDRQGPAGAGHGDGSRPDGQPRPRRTSTSTRSATSSSRSAARASTTSRRPSWASS